MTTQRMTLPALAAGGNEKKVKKILAKEPRRYVASQQLRVAYVPTHLNLADFFTKALMYRAFADFRNYIGIAI